MKKKAFFISFVSLFLGLNLTTKAQESPIQVITNKEAINLADSAKMYKTLLQNTPIEPEFMYEPHFAIVGFNNKFYFSTGARLRFTACFDWGNPVDNPTEMGVDKIEKADEGNESRFQMSAGSSQIYFNIIGFPNTQNQVGLFVSLSLDANGNNSYHLKAGQVYMRYRNIQCGYATSLYNDRAAHTYSINNSRPCASGAHNSVQINYQRAFTKHLSFGVGLEIPNVSYTQYLPLEILEEDKKVNSYQKIPDVPLYLNYTFKGNDHIRLSAVLRNITYHNYITMKTQHALGWGLKLTGSYTAGPFDLYATVQGGRAIANYIAGNYNKSLDLVPCKDYYSYGELSATLSLGYIAGIQYNFSPKVFASGIFSMLHNFIPRYQAAKNSSFEDQQKRALTVNANVVWRISDLFSAGVEYVFAQKINENNYSLSNNRVFGMFMMNF